MPIGQDIYNMLDRVRNADPNYQAQQQNQQMQALKMMEEQMKIKQMQAPGDPKLIPGLGWVQVDPMTGQLMPVQGIQNQQTQMPPPAQSRDIGGGFTELDYQDPETNKWERKFEKQSSGEPKSDFTVFERGRRMQLNQQGVKDPMMQDLTISKEWEAMRQKDKTDLRGLAAARNVFDTKTGKVLPRITQDQIDAEPDRYLSATDPDVHGIIIANNFETPTRMFVNTIDKNFKTLKMVEKAYGGNQLVQILNTPINKLQGMIGSGELASIKLVLNSLAGEIGKVESGSLGIRGVDVTQFTHYKESLNENMPYGELLKVVETGKELGANRIDSIISEKARRKQNLGAPLTKDEQEAIKPDANSNKNSGGVMTLDEYLKSKGK